MSVALYATNQFWHHYRIYDCAKIISAIHSGWQIFLYYVIFLFYHATIESCNIFTYLPILGNSPSNTAAQSKASNGGSFTIV